MSSKSLKLTKRDREKCEIFADLRSVDSDLYKKRGNFKREDIVTGALAEIAVYKLLRSYNIKVGEPDFAIYEKGLKSFDCDLTDGKRKFHVKGQTTKSASLYGESWLMQKTDPVLNKNESGHYLIPTNVDLETNEVTIFGIYNIKTIRDSDCIGEPKIEWLRRNKVAIYNDHLEGLMTESAKWSLLYRKSNKSA